MVQYNVILFKGAVFSPSSRASVTSRASRAILSSASLRSTYTTSSISITLFRISAGKTNSNTLFAIPPSIHVVDVTILFFTSIKVGPSESQSKNQHHLPHCPQNRGEMMLVGISGTSGSGKTTLINEIAKRINCGVVEEVARRGSL
jgi:ABC-type glutathione transport system ATPase component